MATTQAPVRNQITLKGSTKIVTEFFEYSVNSILFQRAIYPPEDFKMVKKYGLNMLVTTDDGLAAYLAKIMTQLNEWLLSGRISRLVVAIIDKESQETVERWQFDVDIVQGGPSSGGDGKENADPSPKDQQAAVATKSEKEINAEIAAIIRQITASVTFLPVLENKCAFNILAYTTSDTDVPMDWTDSDARLISGNAEQVRLRSFSTNVHKVEAMVAYRLEDE